jgi:lipopolysaccharide biosynthesis protein
LGPSRFVGIAQRARKWPLLLRSFRAARGRLRFLRWSVWRFYHALSHEQPLDGKKSGVGFVSQVHMNYPTVDCDVRVIAFYLPQFHPIPENDQWWGKGFTEWTNVVDSVPQFIGHYQPRLPSALGFYDLRVIDVQRQQAALAKQYGVYGFMYYYYWFGGRRLLERPLQQMLATPDIDLPFCICWANENWTRRWDGRDDEVLLGQEYSAADDLEFIDSLLPVFRDPRYIRVDGKPLLVVYRSDLMPDPAATVARWTERCITQGEKPPYVLRTDAFSRDTEAKDPTSEGFSGVIEFPPHCVSEENITAKMRIVNPHYQGVVYEYSTVVQRELRKAVPKGYDYYRCAFPSWDNEPRRKGRGMTFAHSSPALYGLWLKRACEHAAKELPADRRFVFVNAWNEWAEGAYLEPDRRYGYAYLQTTADILRAFTGLREPSCAQLPAARRTETCAVILHMPDSNLWEEMLAFLRQIPVPFGLYVSVPRRAYADAHLRINTDIQGAEVFAVDDRGGDMLPFLRIFAHMYSYRYKYICRVSTGHRQQSGAKDSQRRASLNSLLGSSDRIVHILETFDKHLNVGIVAPKSMVVTVNDGKKRNAGEGLPWVDRIAGLLADMGIDYRGEPFSFVPGAMFWFRPEALAGVLRRDWLDEEFPTDSAASNEEMVQALEKVFGVVTGWSGFHIMVS